MSIFGRFFLLLILLMGFTPPFIHNYLLYSGDVVDFRVIDVLLCLGFIFLTILKINKLILERAYYFYAFLVLLQVTYFSVNYTAIRWVEVLYSTGIPIMVLMYGNFKINSRDVIVLFKFLSVMVWVNVFFAIFLSNAYAGVAGQNLIFSNIGGGIPTAWMLFFWLITYDYVCNHKKWVKSILLCIVTLCILSLDSRSVLAAFLFYILIIMFRRKNYIIGFGLIMGAIVSILFLNTLLGRISNIDFSDNSSQLRFNAIFATFDIIEDSYIVGSEVGKYFPRIDKNISEDLISESGNAGRIIGDYILPTEPHNSYLLYGVEYGVIGIFIVAYINIKYSFVRDALDVNILMALFVMFMTSSVLKFDIKLLFLVMIFLLICRVKKRE